MRRGATLALVPGVAFVAAALLAACGGDDGSARGRPIPIAAEVAANRDIHVEVIRAGEGPLEAAEGSRVRVAYVLRRARDGKILDSSDVRGRPLVATLRTPDVIAGWVKGLAGMRAGEVRRIQVPPALAYGEEGSPGSGIGPNEVLVFDVELVGFLPVPEDEPVPEGE